MNGICGMDCTACPMNAACRGCAATGGRPFGGACVLAECCRQKGRTACHGCGEGACALKAQLLAEFHALGIPDLPPVTDLVALAGSYINLELTLPSGQTAKLLDDTAVYLGTQICKPGGTRCYGLAANESHLLVCEYGDGGADPVLIAYRKRG